MFYEETFMGFGYGCKSCRRALNSYSSCPYCGSSDVDQIWKCNNCGAKGAGRPPEGICKKCGSSNVSPGEIMENVLERTMDMSL
jgi:RNA polymerase subunit RPABC4/transcription elongation factor Spt4